MKSIRPNPRNHAAEGDERIRTAARGLSTSYTYDGPGGREGYVYFVQEFACPDEPIKIGFTGHLEERIRLLSLKTGLHLSVLAWFPAVLQTERELHKRWAEHRVKGEWFRPAPEILKAIELVRGLHASGGES